MDISAIILELAAERGSDKTICPSEVARYLWPEEWRIHMDEVRDKAFNLRDAGKITVTQKGIEVIGRDVVGPIRIRIK